MTIGILREEETFLDEVVDEDGVVCGVSFVSCFGVVDLSVSCFGVIDLSVLCFGTNDFLFTPEVDVSSVGSSSLYLLWLSFELISCSPPVWLSVASF